MRPRKRILLRTGKPGLMELYCHLLDVWTYALWAPNVSPCPDAVLVVDVPAHEIPVLVCTHHPAPVVAMVGSERERMDALAVGAAFAAMDHEELRRQLAGAVAKKRGPKPRSASVLGRAA